MGRGSCRRITGRVASDGACESDLALRIERAHVLVDLASDGFAVTEMLLIPNDDEGTYVGSGPEVTSGKMVTLHCSLPPRWLIVVLVGFVAVMGFHGLNSTAWDNGLPHLYAPSNSLRLVTGLLSGVGIAPFMLFVVNISLCKEGRPQAVIGSFKELLGLLAVETLFFLGVTSGAPWLLYPVSLITAGGVVAAFLAITLAIIAQVAPSWGKVTDRWKLLSLVNLALLLTVVELGTLLAYKLWIHQCPVSG